MRISRVKTSGRMRVFAQLPPDAYAIILGNFGELEHRVAAEVVPVNRETYFVQSPSEAVHARTPLHFDVTFLRLDRDLLLSELSNRLQHAVQAPLVFSPRLAANSAAGRALAASVSSLWRDPSFLATPSLASLVKEFVGLLLFSQKNNYSRLLARSTDAEPWRLRVAEEFILANADSPISLGDICAAAGTSARTLQHSFRRKRGCTPMQFLNSVRLERVHKTLSDPEESLSVTSAAAKWGLLHFGRFARRYRVRFGEKPSETLLRNRR